jgi:FKBP-type peptidyl-prolyl cis-trans isomerase FkpA
MEVMPTNRGLVSIHCKAMRRLILLVALIAVAGCGGDSPNEPTPAPPTTSAPYSQTDLAVGTGALASLGNTVNVTYTGWLHNSGRPDAKGTQFDSGTITFQIGTTNIIQGWNQGIQGMRVGGQRRLVIPPELAYGNRSPDVTVIPQNATLVFDVQLNAVQ